MCGRHPLSSRARAVERSLTSICWPQRSRTACRDIVDMPCGWRLAASKAAPVAGVQVLDFPPVLLTSLVRNHRVWDWVVELEDMGRQIHDLELAAPGLQADQKDVPSLVIETGSL